MRLLLPTEIIIPEGKLLLNPNDPVLSGALMLNAFEKHFAEAFRSHIEQGMIIVDVGANIGYYTLIAAIRTGESGKVIACEPESENMQFLQRMTRANSLTTVVLLEYALGDEDARAPLYLHPDNKGKHSLLKVEGHTPVQIETRALDKLFPTLGISRIDVIKIDIEGWEAKALKGMNELLKKFHPTLFFEFAPVRIRMTGEDPLDTLESLCALGYELAQIDERTGKFISITDNNEFIMTLHGYDGYANIRATCEEHTIS